MKRLKINEAQLKYIKKYVFNVETFFMFLLQLLQFLNERRIGNSILFELMF